MRTKLLIILLFLAPTSGLAGLIWHHQNKSAYPPEVEAFRNQFTKIQDGMNEAEVDAILGEFTDGHIKNATGKGTSDARHMLWRNSSSWLIASSSC